jgi:uncharacterized protein YceK
MRARTHRRLRAALGAVGLLASPACMSATAHTTLISDASHLGTPYPGVRLDVHWLICFAREVRNDASALLFSPLAIFHLIDLPFSAVADTLLLAVDIPLEPDAEPLVPGRGSCKLFGM